jgi:bifunctional DNA primase/polymerase-like protein
VDVGARVATTVTAGYEVALAHAARGRRVFPFKLVGPDVAGKFDKIPLFPWLDDATTDEVTIIGWAKRWPNAYAGWRLPEGTALADVDDREAFAATGLDLPAARHQTTIRGGEHRLYFAEHADQTVKKIPGLDTRVAARAGQRFIPWMHSPVIRRRHRTGSSTQLAERTVRHPLRQAMSSPRGVATLIL